jgi:16S rRNA processing protein RimM
LPRFAVMAKIGAPHGVKGDLKLHLYSEADLSAFSALWFQFPGSKSEWQLIPPHRRFSRGQLDLIHFDGWNDRDEARRFTNALIGIEESLLPVIESENQDRSFYWSTLEGMSVVNLQGVHFGVVDHLFETGANDVLVVKGETRERLLPFIESVIRSVDGVSRVISVDWDQDF